MRFGGSVAANRERRTARRGRQGEGRARGVVELVKGSRGGALNEDKDNPGKNKTLDSCRSGGRSLSLVGGNGSTAGSTKSRDAFPLVLSSDQAMTAIRKGRFGRKIRLCAVRQVSSRGVVQFQPRSSRKDDGYRFVWPSGRGERE